MSTGAAARSLGPGGGPDKNRGHGRQRNQHHDQSRQPLGQSQKHPPIPLLLPCAGGLSAVAILIGSRVADVPAQPQPPGPNHDHEAKPSRRPEQQKRVSFHVILDVALLRVAWVENGRRPTDPELRTRLDFAEWIVDAVAQAGHIDATTAFILFNSKTFG